MIAVLQTVGVIAGLIIIANVAVFGPLLLRAWRDERDHKRDLDARFAELDAWGVAAQARADAWGDSLEARAAVAKLATDAPDVIDAAREEQAEFDRHVEDAHPPRPPRARRLRRQVRAMSVAARNRHPRRRPRVDPAAPGVCRMSAPKRIQRKRTKGWRMPEGAVYVGRPTRWGNPFKEGDPHPTLGRPMDRQDAVDTFVFEIECADIFRISGGVSDLIRRELAGKDLACWCPLDQPCHADVLLEIANKQATP